jgi:murein endopeptidase
MPTCTRIAAAALAGACPFAVGACDWGRLHAGVEPRAARLDGRAPRIEWRRSVAIGSPSAGRLVRGVRLPAQGRHFLTWDPVRRRSPNRGWRRHGTDRLVRLVLQVARDHGRAHPNAARVAIGDLSRPRGGDFGPRFGYIGHASHQNGLDVDVYYPRADGRERAPRYASEIDRERSQDLVDRFVAAGAVTVFVGPNTGLTGPPGVVVPLANHDNHLHVRIR